MTRATLHRLELPHNHQREHARRHERCPRLPAPPPIEPSGPHPWDRPEDGRSWEAAGMTARVEGPRRSPDCTRGRASELPHPLVESAKLELDPHGYCPADRDPPAAEALALRLRAVRWLRPRVALGRASGHQRPPRGRGKSRQNWREPYLRQIATRGDPYGVAHAARHFRACRAREARPALRRQTLAGRSQERPTAMGRGHRSPRPRHQL